MTTARFKCASGRGSKQYLQVGQSFQQLPYPSTRFQKVLKAVQHQQHRLGGEGFF